jgi:hypothetical protein
MSESSQWEYKLISVPLFRLDETALSDKKAVYEQIYEFSSHDELQALMTELGRLRWDLHSVVHRTEDRRLLFIFKRAKK